VELKGERGSIFFRSIWRDNKNIGIEPVEYAQPFSVPFLPLTETDFAGYHLGMAKNVRISFNLDHDKSVISLTIHCTDDIIDATKISK